MLLSAVVAACLIVGLAAFRVSAALGVLLIALAAIAFAWRLQMAWRAGRRRRAQGPLSPADARQVIRIGLIGGVLAVALGVTGWWVAANGHDAALVGCAVAAAIVGTGVNAAMRRALRGP